MLWGLSFPYRPQWVGCLAADVLERPHPGFFVVPATLWDSFVVVEESFGEILAPAMLVVDVRCVLDHGASGRLHSHALGTADVESHDVGERWTKNLLMIVDQDRLGLCSWWEMGNEVDDESWSRLISTCVLGDVNSEGWCRDGRGQ